MRVSVSRRVRIRSLSDKSSYAVIYFDPATVTGRTLYGLSQLMWMFLCTPRKALSSRRYASYSG
jgi:hypothetical protein